PRDGDVIIPRGVEAFQLPRDESQGRGDDDLVDDGGVRARENRMPEPTVAAARRGGVARGTGEEEQDRQGRRLLIPVSDSTAEADDLRPDEGFVGVREHRST